MVAGCIQIPPTPFVANHRMLLKFKEFKNILTVQHSKKRIKTTLHVGGALSISQVSAIGLEVIYTDSYETCPPSECAEIVELRKRNAVSNVDF